MPNGAGMISVNGLQPLCRDSVQNGVDATAARSALQHPSRAVNPMSQQARQPQQTPYQMLGEEGVRKLAAALYEVMGELPQAQPIRAMHGEDLTDIKQKLFEYLSGWLGGPHLYHQKYGTICLHKPHAQFAIGEAERDQWLLCMQTALQRTGASEELQQMLKEPLFRIADTLRTQ